MIYACNPTIWEVESRRINLRSSSVTKGLQSVPKKGGQPNKPINLTSGIIIVKTYKRKFLLIQVVPGNLTLYISNRSECLLAVGVAVNVPLATVYLLIATALWTEGNNF